MNALRNAFLSLAALSTTLCVPTYGRVAIRLLHPSAASPQAIGTPVTWTARATDSGAGPLTFQFSVQSPGGSFLVVRDFNVGSKGSKLWTSPALDSPTACVPNNAADRIACAVKGAVAIYDAR